MQAGIQQYTESDEVTQFTDALINNAVSGMYNLHLNQNLNNKYSVVRSISVVALENFAPEFNFFSSASGISADPQDDCFLGRYGFTAAMGLRFAGAGVWRYNITGLAIPYFDADNRGNANPSRLHVVLANRDATAKTAGATGYITVRFWLEQLAEGR